MKKFYSILPLPYFIFALLLSCILASGQTPVGSGSYTTVYPGANDVHNNTPGGTPQLSKTAVGKPVPTNDWWSRLIRENHAGNLFNYPMTMKTTNTGLIVTYIPWGVIGDNSAIEVGLAGLSTTKATVSDYSDWTVTMNWNDGSRDMEATSGIGMPFVYFEKNSGTTANVTVNSGTVTVSNELLIIENASNGADFAVYAPVGSTWSASGNTYTSSLNGKNYWSMAMLPQSTTNVSATAQAYKKYAYVFPTNTTTSWNYDPATAKLTTDFLVSTEVKEGTHTNVLMGLLPHQWANLDSNSPTPGEQSYDSVRGELKMLDGNSFTVANTFKGVLPTLPYLANYSNGFDPTKLEQKIGAIENNKFNWEDSYNQGQMLNRMIQTARIADQMGDTEALNKMVATIKERLEDWLSYQSGEISFLFYYDNDWTALLGFPQGHGQSSNLNDHHFHWGYFIHAAAFMEQFEPGWADDWGDMVNLLVRDAASSDRNDTLFPFLRNFSPYAGHSWANGFANANELGNDQESSSESMQFATSLIHWGSITANDAIRDLGIYIYTTEQSATEEYFFDMYNRIFRAGQQYKLVSRVWGNSYDNQTFWTGDIEASYGIELYPIHGGSLYLGHNKTYAAELWSEMASNTGILSNEANHNLWHDTYWKFLSLTDAQAAIDLYDSYPDRGLKFGVSDAQTYHWLHAMNALGPVDASITSNHALAVAFTNNSGTTTYVAQNYSNSQISVSFSDGYVLDVAANTLATSRDVQVSGTLSSDFSQAFVGGSVNLTYSTSNTNITKVEFYDGTALISTDTTAPYQAQPSNLDFGVHGMYAKVFLGQDFAVSNIISVQVGEQVPYSGVHLIPGTIEAGHFDSFEGGAGQNISYFDSSQNNAGDARLDEYVDAATVTNEGMTVGWTTAGEWLEYSVDVQTAGTYSVAIRYASGNSNGGGPMHFELDGETISGSISFSTTATKKDDWDTWTTKTVTGLALTSGEHILRVAVDDGEFNLGKMTFTRTGDLGYDPPVANAGTNVSTTATVTSAVLDGSGSYIPSGKTVTYAWSQIYGPTQLNFATQSSASSQVSNLAIGVYKCLLTVSDGTYTSTDDVLLIVSASGNSNPFISINSPAEGTSFAEGSTIDITTRASDLDGSIVKVEFFAGSTKIGEDTSDPFTFTWNGAAVGTHQLTAKATDNGGGVATSQAVAVTVNEVASCVITDNAAIQGSFSVGYETTFETVGTNVTITITVLDTDKSGLVAYLWRESPFQESQMNHDGGKTFSKTVGGLSAGQTISYAVKFAFEGGMAVTKYMSYIVGNDCGNSDTDNDGVSDDIDVCPNTPNGETADATGCSPSQKDTDNDGVSDDIDVCPSTKSGVQVDAFGCPVFALPSTNFSIETINTSCIGTLDGTISISVQDTSYNYTVRITGQDDVILNATTSSANVSGLASGTYSVCISVSGSVNYEQCFEAVIGEPLPLSANVSTNSNNQVILSLSGNSEYYININGVINTTSMSYYNAQLQPGVNTIKVSTDLSCQGVITHEIIVSDKTSITPNPFKDILQIFVEEKDGIVDVTVYGSNGAAVFKKEYYIDDGSRKFELDLSNIPSGTYMLSLHGQSVYKTFKIIKE